MNSVRLFTLGDWKAEAGVRDGREFSRHRGSSKSSAIQNPDPRAMPRLGRLGCGPAGRSSATVRPCFVIWNTSPSVMISATRELSFVLASKIPILLTQVKLV